MSFKPIKCPICGGKMVVGETDTKTNSHRYFCGCGATLDSIKAEFASPITFGPDYRPHPSTAATDLTVIAEEIRKSVALGYDKAIEFYQAMIQPPPQAQAAMQRVVMPGEPEEEEFGPGVLDLNSLYEQTPEAREAILRAHGLQTWAPATPAPEPDPTHEAVGNLIKAPPSAEESEDL